MDQREPERHETATTDRVLIRNVVVASILLLSCALAGIVVLLVANHWRDAARYAGLPVVPEADRTLANARLRGDVAAFFGPDSYPDAARARGEQGRVFARLSIDAAGVVTGCRVERPSGSASLDATTCRIATERVRFDPARDAAGRPIASTYPLAIRWQLQ